VFVILDSVIPMENPWRLNKEFRRITATTVGQIYSHPAVCIRPDTDLPEIAHIMSERKLYTLPVVDEGRLVGVVGKGDLIRSLV